jgi:hypothetical protein
MRWVLSCTPTRHFIPAQPTDGLPLCPSGATTETVLYRPDENWKHCNRVIIKSQALTLDGKEMTTSIEQPNANGIQFIQDSDGQPWAPFATVEVSEANLLLLVEQSAG